MNAVSFKTISTLDELLTLSATHHHNICPRQVLGVRAGLLAGLLLDLPLPQPDKRLIAIAETDGCFVDRISAATGCYVGRRTLRVEDYGKTAASFIDSLTEQAIRIARDSTSANWHGTTPRRRATNGKRNSSATNTSPTISCSTGNTSNWRRPSSKSSVRQANAPSAKSAAKRSSTSAKSSAKDGLV